jgi:ABC-2 type transport system permease protein
VREMLTICRKELADHFNSTFFILIYTGIVIFSLFIAYTVGDSLKTELEGVAKPTLVFLMLFTTTGKFYFSLVQFIAIFGPIMGIVLGFSAINRERSGRTLSKLASQPIYRDSIINAKFLAGLFTITIVLLAITLLISGLGLILVGVVPGAEEVGRLAVYFVFSIFYIAFWLGISILFSIVFRGMITSVLAAFAFWFFFSFFFPIGVNIAADAISPVNQSEAASNPEILIQHEETQKILSTFSPISLYNEATSTILDPMRKTTRSLVLMGPMERLSISRFQNPLPLSESLYIVLPQFISLIAITLVCFSISYLVFMRQEIRST